MTKTIALTSLFLAAVSAQATTLGTFNGVISGSGSLASDPVRIYLGVSPTTAVFCPGATCADLLNVLLTPSSVGTSFNFDSSNATFGQVTGLLTDGQPDYLWQLGSNLQGSGGGNAAVEATRFNLSTVDFAADTITSISTTITSNFRNNGFNGYVFSTVVIGTQGTGGNSPAPEPSSWFLLLSGTVLVGFGSARKYSPRPYPSA